MLRTSPLKPTKGLSKTFECLSVNVLAKQNNYKNKCILLNRLIIRRWLYVLYT